MSVIDGYPLRGSKPELRAHVVRLLGTGAAVPTLEVGEGITVTRASAGVLTLTWGENPGAFVAASHTFQAATPNDMAGHTLVIDTFASLAMPLQISDAADAADDLEANEYLTLIVWFKQTSL